MKQLKCFTRPGYVKYYGTNNYVMVPETWEEKAQETRGVWFSTVANIDIAIMEDVPSYKQALIDALDVMHSFNLNTVVFQVRPLNDAWYESQLNPWSRYITGTEGQDPGFDVLAFVIEEAKQRDIEVHAWLNPYRVSNKDYTELGFTNYRDYLTSLHAKNFARRHPDLVIETAKKFLILDPARPEVQAFVAETAYEIASNYDVKAIHMDDYFYPYEPIIDPDEEAKRLKYAPHLELADFRRYNVDRLIETVHKRLLDLDHKVEFGISPFGIWKVSEYAYIVNGYQSGGDPRGTNCAPSCFECYTGLYADVLKWMEKRWIDYVVPQIYFEFDNYRVMDDGDYEVRAPYADLCDWWSEASRKTNTKLYVGQGLYRYREDGNWSNPEEIINQLYYNQLHDNISGTIFFTYRDLVRDCQPLAAARKQLKQLWSKRVTSCTE